MITINTGPSRIEAGREKNKVHSSSYVSEMGSKANCIGCINLILQFISLLVSEVLSHLSSLLGAFDRGESNAYTVSKFASQ